MSVSKIVHTALGAALAIGLMSGTASADSHEQEKGKQRHEKCYGVVKAGHNGCAAGGTHSCQGQSKVDGDPNEWVMAPKGLCDKLVNGSTEPKG